MPIKKGAIVPKKQKRVMIDDDVKRKFLEAIALTGSVMRAVDHCGASYMGIMKHRKGDKDFERQIDEAHMMYNAYLEEKLHERAIEGTREYLYNKDGDPILEPNTGEHAYKAKPSDRLLELLLKRRMPEYRDKFEHEHRVSGGVLLIAQQSKSIDEWQKRHKIIDAKENDGSV